MSSPPVILTELAAGDSKKEEIKLERRGITGSFDLEKHVCSEGRKGLSVWVRVTWRNEKDHVFDEVHRYRLICTTVSYQDQIGYSFTFIPEGIMHKKDTKFTLSKDEAS